MTFNAFRPLAGGFLTGGLVNGQTENTRFADANPLGKFAQKLFGAGDLHDAMREFDKAVRERGLTPTEVAVRWLAFHSDLGDGDGIILGASKVRQVKETAGWIVKGELNDDVVKLTEQLWDGVKASRGEII